MNLYTVNTPWLWKKEWQYESGWIGKYASLGNLHPLALEIALRQSLGPRGANCLRGRIFQYTPPLGSVLLQYIPPLGSVLVHSFIHNNRPHCCHHRHHHHRLVLGIDNPSIHVIGESQSCVHKSRMQYECVTKANTFVLLTIQSRTFTKGFIQRGPIFSASTYRFFHRCAPKVWRGFSLVKLL